MGQEPNASPRRFALLFAALLLLHAFLLCFDYGRLPQAPVLGDEVIINDPSVSLSLGHGFRAESLAGSHLALDQYYGHFPPLYQLAQALVFRLFGVSVYSLRLTSALADLACIAVLFAGLTALVRWRLADRSAVVPLAVFSSLNAVYITMNRIARPDSMVGLFGLLGLVLIVAALFAPAQAAFRAPEDAASGLVLSGQALSGRQFGLLLLGAASLGLSLATHLEAILLAAFGVTMIALSSRGTWLQRLSACVAMPVVFAAVWFATLGHNALAGWQQMHRITYLDDRIAPGLVRQWHVLTSDFVLSVSGPYVMLFLYAVVLLGAVPVLAFWMLRLPRSQRWTQRQRLALALGAGCIVDLLLLQFYLPNSPRRYGMMLPSLLMSLAAVLPPLGALGRKLWGAAAGLFAIASILMLAAYFRRDHHDLRLDPKRYDAAVNHIALTLPPGGRIATSKSLWLDFRQHGVPVTIFYEPAFDGLSPWNSYPRDNLDSFDTVVLIDTNEDDQLFRPNALRGRKQTDYPAGDQVVQVYQRAR